MWSSPICARGLYGAHPYLCPCSAPWDLKLLQISIFLSKFYLKCLYLYQYCSYSHILSYNSFFFLYLCDNLVHISPIFALRAHSWVVFTMVVSCVSPRDLIPLASFFGKLHDRSLGNMLRILPRPSAWNTRGPHSSVHSYYVQSETSFFGLLLPFHNIFLYMW